ncbi:rifamycin-inactivating phosphotransferase [Longimicrobium terrae]|uniref:Prodigiosin synthesizing transferase PigC n=1 Tax=Longimicrobium terrae TaxID=1639882 RepID=A0A841GR76_9BACT|nr:rifamycin-inactivating phosphotransferase [Longimicrobium terrae]MBB4635216.1 pyruvate,water dikinase [Longimicrobium terrae]MBB6069610.1 pyruvate,water dikinase [Longimicrobium terrae]NNC31589.1 phosphoenolpyruvate synthase [Longimicrobium terrae]
MIDRFVLDLGEVDRTQIALAGGKGAHLGELSRIGGVRVPRGFCVTTDAFRRIMAESPSINHQLERLSHITVDDRDAIRTLSGEIRATLESAPIPGDMAAAITGAVARLGGQAACAVRSSATAEDLPGASFAGQQDTYLNISGSDAILRHISRCWASLFAERAVTYRLRSGFDHRRVHMAVVVQRMIEPHAAGILFTADPVTGHRKFASVEASFGLGEALVSGRVNADVYKVRDGGIVARTIGDKRLAIHAAPEGGTREHEIDPGRRSEPALADAQVLQLVQLGRRIEAHFGAPQDIEWCLADDEFHIVQSRPITTLFPIPAADDGGNHVYVSVGHQQMMTDAMKPLGLSFWQMTTPRPMAEAGGRLFVDVTRILASPAGRADLMGMLGKSDPLIGDALQTVIGRDGFLPPPPEDGPGWVAPSAGEPGLVETDPAIVEALIAESQASIAAARRDIRGKSGPALFDFILADMRELKRLLFDLRSRPVIMGAMEAAWWLNERLEVWLGEKNAADTLTQSVAHNVTSEMGLALLDVADAIRPHPDVVSFLQHGTDEDFLDELLSVTGGREARDAIAGWLDRYGMRGAGEIDITRPRWSERPGMLVPLILGNVRNFEPGEAARRFEQGRRDAAAKEQDVLARLRALPGGEEKAEETRRMIDRVRAFAGYREYPKYGMVSRYFVYKQALMEEAARLVHARVLRETEDIFYLRFDELHDAVRTNRVDHDLIRQRRDAFRTYQALTPPRVLTSEGEAVAGAYRRDGLPTGALVGLAVSAGTVEGRARVILDMAKADLEPGDILVTAFTDPSWTPLFVSIAGLVTEVGGLMTHGAVIAREYGLPAVVGVQHATRLIRDGQRIRVHGTDGYVEVLP